MINKLRRKIISKLAQEQTPQPSTTVTKSVVAPSAPPADLFSHLSEGYNGATVSLLTALTGQLNTALHYASNGKFNFQSIINNNMDLSGIYANAKNIGSISQRFYNTFLNRKNSFNGKKVTSTNIITWADSITNSPEYNNLSQINPASQLAIKLKTNLKSVILYYMNNIKQVNPAVQ